jgi:hypothetical protein
MSSIKRFWNNIVKPSLNDALDRFNDEEPPTGDYEEETPTRRRTATNDTSALEREVAESKRRLEEAERRLQQARQNPAPQTAQPRPQNTQQERSRRAPASNRDPFLEEAERELDEALKRVQGGPAQAQTAQTPQARARANYSDDDAARWVAQQQQARNNPQGQRRPQGQQAPRPNNQVPQHYAMLRLQNGASLEQVKDAYRRLMREHHPDRYANDPVKHRQATETSQKLSRAYMELRRHLGDLR